MDVEEARDYCLTFRGVTEGFPFDSETLVFKVMGKMFCLMGLDNKALSLKNHPEKVAQLLTEHNFVSPGYHMNKLHWFRADLEHTPERFLKQWIAESYELVVAGLTASQRIILNQPEVP